MYRIDVGFDPDRGYGAVIFDIRNPDEIKQKGIKGNSIQQITSRIRNALNELAEKERYFPLESEPSRIIKPNGF